ncbi:MAG: DUF1007 family protein [Pseudomonadota bacterium]
MRKGKERVLIRAFIMKVSMCLIVSGLMMQSAAAHPHSWIDMKADMILDDSGRLTAIRQLWYFDAYFSTVTLADAISEHGDKEVGLQKMADQFVVNLSSFQYFSELTIGGAEIELPRPSSYQLVEDPHQNQSILILEMLFDITPAPLVSDKNMLWSVFDPTYYIAMNYTEVENVSIKSAAGTHCVSNLDVPNPSFELVEYAQNLDRTRKDTDGLGVNFAEKVQISCSADTPQ